MFRPSRDTRVSHEYQWQARPFEWPAQSSLLTETGLFMKSSLYDWAGRTNSWVKLVGNQQLHIPVHLKITLVHLSNEPGPEEPRRNSRGKDLQNGRNA